MIKYFWGIVIIAGIVLYFLISPDYYKGVSLGVSILGIAGLCIDTFLHERILTYLETLKNL